MWCVLDCSSTQCCATELLYQGAPQVNHNSRVETPGWYLFVPDFAIARFNMKHPTPTASFCHCYGPAALALLLTLDPWTPEVDLRGCASFVNLLHSFPHMVHRRTLCCCNQRNTTAVHRRLPHPRRQGRFSADFQGSVSPQKEACRKGWR